MTLQARITLLAQRIATEFNTVRTWVRANFALYKSVEIDFGTSGRREKTFTISDADVSPTSKISVFHSAVAATGKSQDENEMDTLLCRAVAGTGEFTLYVTAYPSIVSGKFRINYIIGG